MLPCCVCGTTVAFLLRQFRTLLRAKPPKGGDAELGGFGDHQVAMPARPPATRDVIECVGGLFHFRPIAIPSRERDKGKPGESRRRKAPRLPHAVRVPRQSSRRSPKTRGFSCTVVARGV